MHASTSHTVRWYGCIRCYCPQCFRVLGCPINKLFRMDVVVSEFRMAECHQPNSHAISHKRPYTKKGISYYISENKGTVSNSQQTVPQPGLSPSFGGRLTKGAHSSRPKSGCASECVHVSELPCGPTATVSHPSWPSGSPRRSKIKQQSAPHSEQLPHPVGRSGTAPH